MSKNLQPSIPSWLEAPPTGKIKSPVETREQELPFGELTWEDFEKLCLRLARLEVNVEHCQLYGVRGQDQEGIDIYARQRLVEKYRVYQCKRVKDFGVANIKDAVSKFLEGKWVSQTDTFVLCTQVSLNKTELADEIETQNKRLKRQGITLLPWGSDQLSIALKGHPEIVDDFFGRTWVAAFCGREQADSLGKRPEVEVAEHYRLWLREKTVHLKVPGLPLSEELSIETNWIPLRAKLREDSNESFDAEFIAELYRLSVMTGTPGTGKSTLMNRLAHRLSASGKRVLLVRLPEVQKLWRKQGGFEDAILKASADNSGLSEEELRLALSAPDYLLADGLDECNGDRANIAKELETWIKAPSRRSITRVVVTTRIGHEPGLLPGWKHTEISPLDQSRDGSSIQKYAKQLLNASLDEEAEVEKRLALLENQLQTNKKASLAARNPLLLGFLVQLIAEGKSIRQNRAELYRDIIKLAYKRPPLDREPIELKERDAQHILEIAGWKLLQEPELSADELIDSLIEELKTRDYTLREAEEKAEAGVEFWENRCIFERRSMGNQDLITFIHPTLGEYAAGRYASRLDDEKLGEWLEEVRRDSRWREPILLAAGLGAGETIVKNLLEFDNPEEPSSEDAILAAFVLAEMIDPPSKLLEVVGNCIRLQVESHIPHIAFKAADAMLELAKLAPDFIGSIAKSLLQSSNSWTRLAATGLALVCGEDYVDLDILKEVLDDIVTEPVQSPVLFKLPFLSPPKLSKKSKEYGEHGWAFQNQVLLDGFQLLLQKQPDLETAKQIEQVISKRTLSLGIGSSLRELLIAYVLENLKSRDKQEQVEEWRNILWRLIRPDQFFEEASPQKLLEILRQRKQTNDANRAILEAILRTTPSNLESSLPKQQSRKPVVLAILLRGMGWSSLPHCYWSLMNENSNLDAVDAVFRGAIAAMEIDSQTLSTEASFALEHIQHYDLEAIESVLLNEGNSTEQEWPWEQIEKLCKADEDPFNWSICSGQIPEVPKEPKWELAQKLGLSVRELVRALKHPSPVIVVNAAKLLVHNAGGSEAVLLVRELLREETGLAPNLREGLEYWVQQCLE